MDYETLKAFLMNANIKCLNDTKIQGTADYNQHRIEVLRETRRELRSKNMLTKRKIPDVMSAYNTPAKATGSSSATNLIAPKQLRQTASESPSGGPLRRSSQSEEMTEARRLKLQQWKEAKNKRLAEQKRAVKPVFKVCHVKDTALPTIIKDKKSTSVVPVKQQSFGPLVPERTKYDFKAPRNIQPLLLRKPTKLSHPSSPIKMRVTRSQKPSAAQKLPVSENRKPQTPHDTTGEKRDKKTEKSSESKVNIATTTSTSSKGRVRGCADVNKVANQRVTRSTNPASVATKKAPQKLSKKNIQTGTLPTGRKTSKDPIPEIKPAPKTRKLAAKPKNINEPIKETPRTSKDVPKHAQKPKTNKYKTPPVKPEPTPIATETEITSPNKPREFVQTRSQYTPDESDCQLPTALTKTPIVQMQSPSIAYVSPFVTVSRGKQGARKEYAGRKSRGGLIDTPDLKSATGAEAGAQYFQILLNREIAKISEECDKWKFYKEGNELEDDICDMINTAVGQGTLLVNKKMQQFQQLIHQSLTTGLDFPVTCEDLHGFWDMVYMQVENVGSRFENIARMRDNNWEDIRRTVVATVMPKQVKKVQVMAKVEPKVRSSSLRDAIKAARIRKNNGDVNMPNLIEMSSIKNSNEATNADVATPQSRRKSTVPTSYKKLSMKQRISITCTPKLDVMTDSCEHGRISPYVALAMSQAIKSIGNPAPDAMTPTSILKPHNTEDRIRKRSKVVLFRDEDMTENISVGNYVKTPRKNRTKR